MYSSFSMPNVGLHHLNQDIIIFPHELALLLPLFPQDTATRIKLLKESLEETERYIKERNLTIAMTSGCTAIVALRLGEEVIFANMGDSVGMLIGSLEADPANYQSIARDEAGNEAAEQEARERGAHFSRKYWFLPENPAIRLQPLSDLGDIMAGTLLRRTPTITHLSATPDDVVLVGSDGLLSSKTKKEGDLIQLDTPDAKNQLLIDLIRETQIHSATLDRDWPAMAIKVIKKVRTDQRLTGYRAHDDASCILLRSDGCIACFDGHGEHGKTVASLAKSYFKTRLCQKVLYDYLSSQITTELTPAQQERLTRLLFTMLPGYLSHTLEGATRHQSYCDLAFTIKSEFPYFYSQLFQREGLLLTRPLTVLTIQQPSFAIELFEKHSKLKDEVNWPLAVVSTTELERTFFIEGKLELAVLALAHQRETFTPKLDWLIREANRTHKTPELLLTLSAHEPHNLLARIDTAFLYGLFQSAALRPSCYTPRHPGITGFFKGRIPEGYDDRLVDTHSIVKATLHMVLHLELKQRRGFVIRRLSSTEILTTDKMVLIDWQRRLAKVRSSIELQAVFQGIDAAITDDSQPAGLRALLKSFRRNYPIDSDSAPRVSEPAAAH